MGMDILLNERVWFPANYDKSLMIQVGSLHHKVKCPKVDTSRVCAISVRLGEYKGYDLAIFLDQNTGGEMNGNEWLFGTDDAKKLIERIDEELENFGSSLDREDLEDIRKVLGEALANEADQFEVFLG